jgi:hypothetical protein
MSAYHGKSDITASDRSSVPSASTSPPPAHSHDRGENEASGVDGNEPIATTFTSMKFLKWCESVDHLVIPLAVDIGVAIFAAGFLTASLRYLFGLTA